MFSIQQQENDEYEANARYDYLSEAYGATARSCNEMAAADDAMEMEYEIQDTMVELNCDRETAIRAIAVKDVLVEAEYAARRERKLFPEDDMPF